MAPEYAEVMINYFIFCLDFMIAFISNRLIPLHVWQILPSYLLTNSNTSWTVDMSGSNIFNIFCFGMFLLSGNVRPVSNEITYRYRRPWQTATAGWPLFWLWRNHTSQVAQYPLCSLRPPRCPLFSCNCPHRQANQHPSFVNGGGGGGRTC